MASLGDLLNPQNPLYDFARLQSTDPVTGKYLYGDDAESPYGSNEADYLSSIRRFYKIPAQVSDSQVKQWSRTELPQLIEANRKKSGGFMDQFMEFASPIAWTAAMALGGPVGGTIAAANGSGATSSLGIDPRLTTAGALAYGAYNNLNNGLGSTPNADVAGSEYGVAGTAPVKPDYWSNTYAANNTGTLTDAGTGEAPMWDWLDSIDPNASFDPGAEGMWNPPAPGVGDAGAFDQWGSMTGATDNSFNPSDQTIFGGTSSNPTDAGIFDTITQYASKLGVNPTSLLQLLKAGAGAGGSTAGRILGNAGSDPLGTALGLGPLAASLYMANQQRKDIEPQINRLNALQEQFQGNTPAYLKSLTDPFDQQTGTGRFNLQNDLGLRGVSGSSFGDQALNSYDYTRGLGRGNLLSQGITQGIGAQSGLIGQQISAINNRNLASNALIGAGAAASGRLLSPQDDFASLAKRLFAPQSDPFNLGLG